MSGHWDRHYGLFNSLYFCKWLVCTYQSCEHVPYICTHYSDYIKDLEAQYGVTIHTTIYL